MSDKLGPVNYQKEQPNQWAMPTAASYSEKTGQDIDEEIQRLLPILQRGASDSASLDNMFEFLLANGFDFFLYLNNLNILDLCTKTTCYVNRIDNCAL